MYRRFNCSTMAPTPSFAAPCTISCCASATRRTRCPPSGSNPPPTPLCRLRSPGSGAARPPPSACGICPRQGLRQSAGYTSHCSHQNRAGDRFPLANCQGFFHTPPPFSTMPLLGPPATAKCVQIRSLGLSPRGLGEPCGGYEPTWQRIFII
jgi:hypothetical protein